MRIIFTGRDNPFNRRIVKDFSEEHEVVCCLFLEPERSSFKGKRKKIFRRIKRFGLMTVLDQLAFHAFDRLFMRKSEPELWKKQPNYSDLSITVSCPVHYANNINGKKWIELCREIKPDIILATCSHVILKPELYTIPALGTYIVHEGLTPEYKGLHTPLWALMKKEFQYIGYTVFKVNDEIDGGEVFAQEAYTLGEGESYNTWSWIGHNAIISGLGNIRQRFLELEKEKSFVPLNTEGRKDGYYTWMGLSSFIWLYFRNYFGKSVSPQQKTVPDAVSH